LVVAGLGFLLGGILLQCTHAEPGPTGAVVVVLTGGVAAYREALAGLRSGLGEGGDGSYLLVDATGGAGPELLAKIRTMHPRAIVSFGSRAAEVAAAIDIGVPVIVSMVLDRGGASNAAALKTVSLEIPFGLALRQLRKMYPQARRIAMVHSMAEPAARLAGWQAEAKHQGVVLELTPCAGAGDLLGKIGPLRNQVDFVWTLPDGALYQPAVISPLILASLRGGLPLIGFSEGFVRAGAAIGFFPDYRDIGVQTAELLLQLEQGKAVPVVQPPRVIRVAVNERVERLLGLDRESRELREVVVIR
jgi:ABC-type uncharacterized transport system substrate-binding protein